MYRPGPINAWDDPNFVAAVEATGKKKLIMASVTTDVCLYFPLISALNAGYDVWAVYDASGCWDMMSEMTSCMRLTQAGAIVVSWPVIAAMLQKDWRDNGQRTLDIFAPHPPFHSLLFNNQNAAKNGIPGLTRS